MSFRKFNFKVNYKFYILNRISRKTKDKVNSKQSELNPNIEFTTLKDSTHLFPLEYPEKTQNLIKNFIDH